jgi:homoaconitase/3-isopropylmalate dehydratase large subunit
MTTSLTRSLIEAHLADAAGRARTAGSGGEAALRIDQVLMDADAATLVFQAFEATGRARAQVELALACAEAPPPSPPFEANDALLYVQSAARRFGVHFSRAGNGRGHHVHAARFAAPGRTLLACAAGAAAAGSLGSLAFDASEVELASALTGAPHTVTVPPLWAVRLEGTMAPWVDAHDLARALAVRLPPGGAAGAVLEYVGPGILSLSQEARLTVARGGAALGAAASLFPSDEVTRGWLLEQGREPDWKALGGEPEGEAERVIALHLDALEPMIGRGDGSSPVSVREAVEIPMGRVVLGADAGLEDLLVLAAALRGRVVAPGIELVVIPGSRQIRHRAAACGALGELIAAGARLADSESRLAPAPAPGAALLCGASARAAGRARAVYRAGPATLAAAALAGHIADPRELQSAPLATLSGRTEIDDALIVKPTPTHAGAELARGAAVRSLPSLPPIVATLRGVVLLRLGDRVGTEVALPGGPKVRRHRADLAALADHLFAGIDRDFPARARAHGGGFLVAGTDYGSGAPSPHAALALVQLGVRAILARSFAAQHRAELTRHGVLTLRFARGEEQEGPRVGDELEIPGLPEVLEPNRPLTVRDLSRGAQFALHHDLTRRQIEMVRAGGLIGMIPALVPA